jgi:Phosphoserine aminotransferase
LNFAGTGLSVMEVSHRSKEFVDVMNEAIALVKELLKVPEGYSVLFLQGGASLQFLMAPYNLMNKKAAYTNTGAWATAAIKEAKFFGEVVEVASSKDANFNFIPKGYVVPEDVDYFHFTSNNTIFGTEVFTDPDLNVPVVCDMSSDIFSRPIDVSKYALIYAGAQKNLGPRVQRWLSSVTMFGKSGKANSDHARLPYTHQRRIDVQHSGNRSCIWLPANIALAERTGWR